MAADPHHGPSFDHDTDFHALLNDSEPEANEDTDAVDRDMDMFVRHGDEDGVGEKGGEPMEADHVMDDAGTGNSGTPVAEGNSGLGTGTNGTHRALAGNREDRRDGDMFEFDKDRG